MVNRFNIGGSGVREWKSLSLSSREMRRAFALADAIVSCSPQVKACPVNLEASGNLRLCNHFPTSYSDVLVGDFNIRGSVLSHLQNR